MKFFKKVFSLFFYSLIFVEILSGCTALDPLTDRSSQEQMAVDISESQDLKKASPEIVDLLPETQVAKPIPKLGIILGPGGALSALQLGFLNELSTNKIPIAGVVGMEWGALVSLLWLSEKGSHGGEWSLINFPHQKLKSSFTKKLFFSDKPDVSEFFYYLKDKWGRRKLSELPLPLACPYREKFNDKLFNKGSLLEAFEYCVPTEKYFKSAKRSSSWNRVRGMVSFLKNRGAEKILYLETLSFLKEEDLRRSVSVENWSVLQSETKQLEKSENFEIFNLGFKGAQPIHFQKLRAFIELGRKSAKEYLMAEQGGDSVSEKTN